jgi:hypothetical protein
MRKNLVDIDSAFDDLGKPLNTWWKVLTAGLLSFADFDHWQHDVLEHVRERFPCRLVDERDGRGIDDIAAQPFQIVGLLNKDLVYRVAWIPIQVIENQQ